MKSLTEEQGKSRKIEQLKSRTIERVWAFGMIKFCGPDILLPCQKIDFLRKTIGNLPKWSRCVNLLEAGVTY